MRSVAIALAALLALPPAISDAAEAADADPTTTNEFLTITLDQLEIPEGASWEPLAESQPLTLHADEDAQSAPQTVSLPVHSIDVFAFDAAIQGSGHVELLVDGVLVMTRRAGDGPIDIRLDGAEHVLTWRFVPDAVNDILDLALHGARPIIAPVLRWGIGDMTLYCAPSDIWLVIDFALPLRPRNVVVALDGGAVQPTVTHATGITARSNSVRIPAPLQGLGTTTVEVHVDVRDETGNLWPLLKRVINYTVKRPDDFAPYAGPDGWVYDQHPGIWASGPWCETDGVTAKLFLDGVESAHRPYVHRMGVSWWFPAPLPYGEEHAWRYEIVDGQGREHILEGTLREGLDVMEFDFEPGTLMFEPTETDAMFAAPTKPIVRGEGYLPEAESWTIVTNVPMHARAVYAPHVIACETSLRERVCDPFGGERHGFDGWVVASADLDITLTFSDGSSQSYHLASAGQFAAASALSGRGLYLPIDAVDIVVDARDTLASKLEG